MVLDEEALRKDAELARLVLRIVDAADGILIDESFTVLQRRLRSYLHLARVVRELREYQEAKHA